MEELGRIEDEEEKVEEINRKGRRVAQRNTKDHYIQQGIELSREGDERSKDRFSIHVQ